MFINVNTIEEIPSSNDIGFLYIFDVFPYDTIKIEDCIKLGMTTVNIKTRLSQYKITPKNISYIQCSLPSKRERLLKKYIKEKLNLIPIYGYEYFKGYRKEIEQVILYFALCEEDIISKYYDLYKDIEEKTKWFNSILLEDIVIKESSLIPEKSHKMSKMIKNDSFMCEFCKGSFNNASNLLRHQKTNKKCLELRPKIEIKCIWCDEVFMSKDRLEKHSSKCIVNKEMFALTLIEKIKSLEEKYEEKIKSLEGQLSQKDSHIKDLEEKLFKIANKSTISNTYNVTLNCDKPLLLSTERVTNLMWRCLTVDHMKSGGEGICRWFLDNVAVNDKGKLSLECTDKTRKIFKYIDENDKLITKDGEEIAELIRICRGDSRFYFESPQGREYQEYVKDDTKEESKFINFKKSFIRSLSEKTYKENLNSHLNQN